MKYTILFAACLLMSCARFTTTQTDIREGKNEKTTITTKATTTTFFNSRSALANFRAAQTEKTQGATVGTLTQDASSTNTSAIIEAVVRAAINSQIR